MSGFSIKENDVHLKIFKFKHLYVQDVCLVKGLKNYEHILPYNHTNILKNFVMRT